MRSATKRENCHNCHLQVCTAEPRKVWTSGNSEAFAGNYKLPETPACLDKSGRDKCRGQHRAFMRIQGWTIGMSMLGIESVPAPQHADGQGCSTPDPVTQRESGGGRGQAKRSPWVWWGEGRKMCRDSIKVSISAIYDATFLRLPLQPLSSLCIQQPLPTHPSSSIHPSYPGPRPTFQRTSVEGRGRQTSLIEAPAKQRRIGAQPHTLHIL